MKLYEAERFLKESLNSIYDPQEAANISALALEAITSFSRSARLLKKDWELTPTQTEKLHDYTIRLKEHEPIHYIMNKAWFYGMELYVDKDVLIPRPETEELVHWIINDIRAEGLPVFTRQPNEADVTRSLKILDVGTGSGCIALALKKEMPLAEVWGCDISDRALNVARRNGSQLNIRVDFQSVDYLDPAQQKHLPSVDIIVSNPPYVPKKDQGEMRPNVLQYEPHTALFVNDDDPLLFYKALLQFSKHRLHESGKIYMEIHENLGIEVSSLFESEGFTTEIRKDMQGKDRMVKVS